MRDTRFIWPEDLIDHDGGFGYIMELINMDSYNTLFRIIAKNELYPSHDVLCKICINMADAFDNLHTAGLCYKDLSHNNILIDIKTGDILIVDVDNVCVSGVEGDIAGTPKFMAPEVVLGKGGPDRDSDKFSLAAIYFYLLLGHNPLEGKLRDDYVLKHGSLDQGSFKEIYGTRATFCFNSSDRCNCLDAPEYKYIVKRWNLTIPQKLKNKFEKTFVTALSFDTRSARTTDKEWVNIFTEMQHGIKRCSCGRDYFDGATGCYHCSASLDISTPAPSPAPSSGSVGQGTSISIKERGASGLDRLKLTPGTTLSGKMIGSSLASYPTFAAVLKNPNTGELGLRNLSGIEWYYKDAGDAAASAVAPGKVIALKSGRVIAFIKGVIQVTVD